MSRDVPTVRYFAVGFFTAAQLEARDRARLSRASQRAAVSPISSAMQVVIITIFGVDTGEETVELGIDKVSLVVQSPQAQAGGVSFGIERFNPETFPGAQTPEDAFTQYLGSDEGVASFGTATAVQLFALNVDAVQDLAKN